MVRMTFSNDGSRRLSHKLVRSILIEIMSNDIEHLRGYIFKRIQYMVS